MQMMPPLRRPVPMALIAALVGVNALLIAAVLALFKRLEPRFAENV